MFSKQKDTDYKILLHMPYVDFFKICVKFNSKSSPSPMLPLIQSVSSTQQQVIPSLPSIHPPSSASRPQAILEYKNKYFNQICKNETLWKERLFKYYGKFYPEEGQTWKNL